MYSESSPNTVDVRAPQSLDVYELPDDHYREVGIAHGMLTAAATPHAGLHPRLLLNIGRSGAESGLIVRARSKLVGIQIVFEISAQFRTSVTPSGLFRAQAKQLPLVREFHRHVVSIEEKPHG